MKIYLSKSDLFPVSTDVPLADLTLTDFAIPSRLLELAEEIVYQYSPQVVRVFKDRNGTYE